MPHWPYWLLAAMSLLTVVAIAVIAIRSGFPFVEKSDQMVANEYVVPGLKAVHATITDETRSELGEGGAISEALDIIRAVYNQTVKGWQVGKGVQIHLVLSVERPLTPTEV